METSGVGIGDYVTYTCRDKLRWLNGEKHVKLKCLNTGTWDKNISDCGRELVDMCIIAMPIVRVITLTIEIEI